MLLYKYMFDTQWMDVDFNHEYGKNQRMQNQIQLDYIITVCLWVVFVCVAVCVSLHDGGILKTLGCYCVCVYVCKILIYLLN